jgi:hypothetical protein
MKEPTISVDRQSKTFAVFDGHKIHHPFTPYTSEEQAIADGKAFCKVHTETEPKIVYPRIDSIRITYVRRRR